MQKDEIADILKEIGVFLELKGKPVQDSCLPNGARTLEGLTEPLEVLIEEERLGKVKGIGSALAERSRNCPPPGSWRITTTSRHRSRRG